MQVRNVLCEGERVNNAAFRKNLARRYPNLEMYSVSYLFDILSGSLTSSIALLQMSREKCQKMSPSQTRMLRGFRDKFQSALLK